MSTVIEDLLRNRQLFVRTEPKAISHSSDNYAVLQELKNEFGGSIRKNTKPGRRMGSYSWNVSGEAAEKAAVRLHEMAATVSPYMSVFLKRLIP